VWRQIRDIQPKRQLPVIAIISREILDGLDSDVGMEDFVVTPLDLSELAIRIKRTIGRTNNIHSEELIRCCDLTIDLAKCEVAIDSRLLALTFKEYQLLKFLASNRGRVFTRQTLLNEVWGYDYYGGDRTVDVHIRRLRSKIEDSTHTFIETALGYKIRRLSTSCWMRCLIAGLMTVVCTFSITLFLVTPDYLSWTWPEVTSRFWLMVGEQASSVTEKSTTSETSGKNWCPSTRSRPNLIPRRSFIYIVKKGLNA
jgi:two-component system alkaline phosphatase synthesis response regulator PhoP